MRLYDDLKEYSQGSKKKLLITLFANPNFHCIAIYRLSAFLAKIHLSFISKILWYINRIIYSVDIDYKSDLFGGLVIIHGIGIVIGRGVVSKGRLIIYHGVTIGGNNHKNRTINSKSFAHPCIEDNVIIYTGAMIIGPVLIGSNVIIGAGTKVSYDVSPNSIIK